MSNPRFTPNEAPLHDLKMKHVLVVDDDADVAASYKEMLEANNYMVSVASNGAEAVKLIMQMDVDAIFCDMMMPTMPGDMFYLAVERVKPHLCQRFIFVTGYEGNPKFEAFFKKLNPSPTVLYKPLTMGKLTGTLNIMLTKLAAAAKKAAAAK